MAKSKAFRGKLGSGTRFKNCIKAMRKKGVSDPSALCASIGRKKYGKKRYSNLSAKGRK